MRVLNLYTAIVIITLFTLVITAADVATNQLIVKEAKTRATFTCVLIGLCALGECIGELTNGAAPRLIPLHGAAKLVEISLSPFIGVAVGVAYGDAVRPRLAFAVAAAHALLECVAFSFGGVFAIDAANIYHRGALFPLYVAAFSLSAVYGLIAVLQSGKAYQVDVDVVPVLTMATLAGGIAGLYFETAVRIAYLCIAVANLIFYYSYYKIMLRVDAVTHLLNRRCYDVSVSELGTRAVILYFDIDRFKQVNDTYGHTVGDLCLRGVSRLLRQVYGRYGRCYRIGGDEFCVILSDGLDGVEALNARFGEAVAALRAGDPRMPGVSIGYACYDAATSSVQRVIGEADAMLYRNKNAAQASAPE